MRSPESVSTFVEVSSELLAKGYGVRFRASGGSMRPAICDGDVITVAPAGEGRVLPGNVIVYRDRGRLFAHRIVSVQSNAEHGGYRQLLLRGDAATTCDAPVSADSGSRRSGDGAARTRGDWSARAPALRGTCAARVATKTSR